MSFCGQCGFQLAPNDTRCPRCGSPIAPEATAFASPSPEYIPDDATVESVRYMAGAQGQYDTQHASPTNQQKLVLGPSTYPPGTNETANMTPPAPGTSYPGYAPQPPPQQTGYQGYVGNNTGYYSGQYPPTQAPRRKSPRSVGLVFIFLGIVLILGALVLFALQHNGIIGSTSTAQSSASHTQLSTATSTAPASTPLAQAQAVVQHLYTSVNAHDYTTAYHLWKDNTETFTDFKNGYSNTQHTNVAFGTGHMQSSTVANVPVTLTATEVVPATGAIKQSTYTGYYLVGKQANGTWLILSGNLQAA
ncbi:MAG TPA: zinc ribbon domain-containing protein [Ktedonobacteraceae bacterium]|jgi:hypothetical protein|nr:zinc ribbon domain-containing protein [Ktedonobacteraceae bacterium]